MTVGGDLPSREELVNRLRAHEKSNTHRFRVTLGLAAIWLVLPVMFIILFKWRNGPFAVPLEALWLVALFGISFASPRWNSWYLRKVELACPSCGSPYIGYSAQIAVGSGRCGRCGERVINDA